MIAERTSGPSTESVGTAAAVPAAAATETELDLQAVEQLDQQLDTALAAARAAFERQDDGLVLAILEAPLSRCVEHLSCELRVRATACCGVRRRALDRLGRFAEAAAACRRAGAQGTRRLMLYLTVLNDLEMAIAAAEASLAESSSARCTDARLRDA